MKTRLASLFTPSNLVALGLLLLSILAVWLLRTQLGVDVFTEEGFRQVVDDLGWIAPLLYIVLIGLAVVISQIPGVPMAIAAGAVWGTFWAGVYSVIGGFAGGMIAYFLGRTLGSSTVQALTGKQLHFTKGKGENVLGWFIFLTRLLPIFSFDLISYAAGVARLSVPIYVAATLFGMIPSTFFLTFLGDSFEFNLMGALGFSIAAVVVLILLPVAIRRWNVFRLNDFVRFE